MPTLLVTKRSGEETLLRAEVGKSVMEAISSHGITELLALCGGCAACGTCHVYVERSFLDMLPPKSDEESGLLEHSTHLRSTSRLSCQVLVAPGLDRMSVTIAPED